MSEEEWLEVLDVHCWDCNDTRAVPDGLGLWIDGYAPCSTCLILSDDGETWVVWE